MKRKTLLLIIGIVFSATAGWCLEKKAAPAEQREIKEVLSTTEHTIRIGKKTLAYTATAGQLVLTGADGSQQAAVFFTAYEKKGSKGSERPITFAFNGGPGSSSVWLHLGAIGPKRVRLNQDGSPQGPPSVLVQNQYTWLDVTDLVFIDPVGTGYSRAAKTDKEKDFYDFNKDIESVAAFIRLYLSRYDRWLSPKCIVGESYGTTRAVALQEHMREKYGIDLNGLLLVSPVLDFQTIQLGETGDLPYALFVPTYAAAAAYHNLQAGEVAQPVVERWALDTYLGALAYGNALSSEKLNILAGQLAGFCGLSADYVLEHRLRVPPWRLRKELLRTQRRIIGRMDARFSGPDADSAAAAGSYDPGLDSLAGTFAGAVNHYLKKELQFSSDLPYWYLNSKVAQSWNWKGALRGGQGFVDVSRKLTDALHINTALQVFVATGLYDLATPYFATRYTLSHLDLHDSLRGNLHLRRYPAGHMMYLDRDVLRQFTEDVRQFYGGMLKKKRK
ncbi:MAG: peptidase S10 [Deltaproteobacteria bacterium]|nr:peptidase S10 [Deltaproteobacteria bacterium]